MDSPDPNHAAEIVVMKGPSHFFLYIGLLATCLIAVCSFVLSGPTPAEAGLVGQNPVVSITVGDFSVDYPWHSDTTINKDGTVIYEAGDGSVVKMRHTGKVDPKIFNELALSFAPYREEKGISARQSKACLTDIVMPQVTWAYANGDVHSASVGNNCSGERDEDVWGALRSLPARTGTKVWDDQARSGHGW